MPFSAVSPVKNTKNTENLNFFTKTFAQVVPARYLCTRKSEITPLRRSEKRTNFDILEETKDEFSK
jgi:hypothetical protein